MTGAGVYKSVDAALSWRPASQGLPAATVLALAVAPTDPRTLYASVLVRSGRMVYRSTDGGASWRVTAALPLPGPGARQGAGARAGGLPGLPAPGVGGDRHRGPLPHHGRRRALGAHRAPAGAADPGHRPGALLCRHRLPGGGGAGVRPRRGVRQRRRRRHLDAPQPGARRPRRRGRGPPAGPAVGRPRVAGAVPQRQRRQELGAGPAARFAAAERRAARQRHTPGRTSSAPRRTPATLYALALSWLWRTTDDGASWTEAYAYPDGPDLQFLRVDPADPFHLWGSPGARQNGGPIPLFLTSTDGGETWSPPPSPPDLGCLAFDLQIAPSAPSVLYAAGARSDSFTCLQTRASFARSTDGGATWSAADGGLNVLSVLAIAVDPRDPQRRLCRHRRRRLRVRYGGRRLEERGRRRLLGARRQRAGREDDHRRSPPRRSPACSGPPRTRAAGSSAAPTAAPPGSDAADGLQAVPGPPAGDRSGRSASPLRRHHGRRLGAETTRRDLPRPRFAVVQFVALNWLSCRGI